MSKGYHPFVFDTERRRFVGDFEGMYRAEAEQGFDSWHQEDMRPLDKRICLDLLADHNFTEVLDVGCGKGAFSQFLKRRNNRVLALDISETALAAGRARFPDVEFQREDVGAPAFEPARLAAARTGGGRFDLIVCMETLSYVETWRDLVGRFAQATDYAMIALFIPENPIGFVKSRQELEVEFARHFVTLEMIQIALRHKIILWGRSKNQPNSL